MAIAERLTPGIRATTCHIPICRVCAASAPLVTSIADAAGVVIYFGIATFVFARLA